jgi:hypothetical protein
MCETQLMVGRDTVTNTCYDKGPVPREPSFGSIGIVRFHQSAGPIAACAPISQIRCYDKSRPVADFRSPSRSDLENERGQLIERVGKLQAHEN